MLDYYTRVLGFAISDRGPMGPPGSPEIVFLSQDPGEHHQLAFVGVPKADGRARDLNHLAFRTTDIDALRATDARIRADGRGRMPTPITHGNTWSIYFGDPEGNGVEVFCDTPWHVQQPQGQTWDMTQDDAALLETTRAAFADEPGFGPGDAYVEARKRAS
jgi:catechol 2,3-dioxygenase